MGVRAAHAERRHARAAWPSRVRPVPCLGEQFDAAGGPVDVRGRLVDVQGRWQDAVPHRLHHLDQPGGAGGGLGVADVRLDRAEPQRPVPVPPVRGEQRLRLDRVAELGSGAVALDGVDLGRVQARVREGLADDADLGGAVGGGEAVGGAVLVDRGARDRGEYGMAVAAGVGEAFEQQQADALAPARTVRGARERLAAAVGGEPALPAERHERGGRRHHRDAPGEGQRAFPRAQRLGGEVQRDEGRGAARVDGDCGSFQAERVRDPAGGDAAGVAGQQVRLQAVRRGADPGAVVVLRGAGEHAGRGAAQGVGVEAGAFERLPGGLQQQALLRVRGEGLAGADAEERGVEVGGVVEEAAVAGVALARLVRVRVVQLGEVPAAVGGEPRDRVAAVADEPPQVLRRPYAAGEPAGHRDDGDRLAGRGRDAGGDGTGRDGPLAEEPLAQEGGEGGRSGVVEDGGDRQAHAGGGGQAVAQFDRGEGVEAELLEGTVAGHGLGRRVAEDRGDVAAYQIEQRLVAVGGGQDREPRGQAGARRGGRRTARGRAHQAAQDGRRVLADVEADRDERGIRQGGGQVEQCEGVLGGQRAHART